MKDKLSKIYDYAELQNIGVYAFKAEKVESMSVMDSDGECNIAINPDKIKSTADEIVKLTHEIGHCQCGAFYNVHSPFDVREKHERRATEWSIRVLIPREQLIEAVIHMCIRSRYELAAYFEVTEDFMQKAITYYADSLGKLKLYDEWE